VTERDALALAVDSLTSEDEIAHGEAVWERDGGAVVETGRCAYCDDEWPCRTQRGIDRLLAAIGPIVASMVANDPPTGRSTHE
jgi:hypothetical protein